MRWLGYSLLGLLLSLLLWWGGRQFSEIVQWHSSGAAIDQREYDSYKVYWLDGPLTFKLPANTEQVRVVLTPVSSLSDSQFTLEFAALGFDGKTQEQGVRIHRQKAMPPQAEQWRFFDGVKALAAGFSQEFYLAGKGAIPLAELHLKIAQGDHPGVAVRVSILERKKDAEVPVLWQRMRREKRLELLEGNIYPVDLVSEAQRFTALKFQWLPVGPEGGNYQSGTLFIKQNFEPELDTQAPLIADSSDILYADERKVFTLVQDPVNWANRFSCLEPVPWLELTYWQEGKITTLMTDKTEVALPLSSEMVRIRAAAPCVLTFFNQANEIIEKTNNVVRGYVLQADNSFSYPLNPGDSVQPLRIAVRGLNLTTANEYVRWQLFDEQQQLLDHGDISLTLATDWYERLPRSELGVLHQKVEAVVLAPSNAASLVVKSEQSQALLNVSNRPVALPYDEQYGKWFSLLPQQYRQAKVAGLTKLMYWQRQLHEEVEINGLQQWRAIDSEPPQPRFEILSSNSSELPLALGYQPLTTGTIELRADDVRSFTPDLIYLRQEGSPLPIQIEIGAHRLSYWLSASAGRIALPAMTAGQTSIAISGGGSTQWFINHLAGAQSHRVRQVHQINKPLVFVIDKTAETEWVTVQYFPADPKAHSIEIKVDYPLSTGQKAAFTLPKRQIQIPQQSEQGGNYLLNQQSHELWGPVQLAFPLESDLKTGSYRMTLVSSAELAGYVQVSYVKDNVDVILQHYTEVAVDD